MAKAVKRQRQRYSFSTNLAASCATSHFSMLDSVPKAKGKTPGVGVSSPCASNKGLLATHMAHIYSFVSKWRKSGPRKGPIKFGGSQTEKS